VTGKQIGVSSTIETANESLTTFCVVFARGVIITEARLTSSLACVFSQLGDVFQVLRRSVLRNVTKHSHNDRQKLV
jgi:hypothetical protein